MALIPPAKTATARALDAAVARVAAAAAAAAAENPGRSPPRLHLPHPAGSTSPPVNFAVRRALRAALPGCLCQP